jgi:hypothetical protein
MLVTLVAVLCSGQMCLEKVVTDSDQSGITMFSCTSNAQAGLAEWLQHSPYAGWQIQSYRCVLGPYQPRRGA